jgi:cysteate synthase
MALYELKCKHPECGKEYPNDLDFRLRCDDEINGTHGPSFLEAVYEKKQITVRDDLPGIFKYVDWLPVGPYYIDPDNYELGRPVTYKSKGLAKRLGLKNLYIAFSGYWPKKQANLLTRTFKEFEGQANTLRYLMINEDTNPMPFIVSSAGNTANGYNLLSHILNLPIYLVIPQTGLDKLLLPYQTKSFVIVVQGDYADAIKMANDIADKTGLTREGGARSVARRAGLGAVMLHAVAHPEQGLKELYDHYFQAVGSGTGAIAAWESVQLLLKDGRFGNTKTKIHMAQNLPFTPICDSWETGKRDFVDIPEEKAKEKISAVISHVLTNRTPPYSIAGGDFDVLMQSNGSTWKVNNYDIFYSARMFRETEGIDIGPAAAVSVDALKKAVLSGHVGNDDKILLHTTGGGREIQYTKRPTFCVEPSVVVKPGEVDLAVEKIGEPSRISHHKKLLKKYE